jgi:hypothetical protein
VETQIETETTEIKIFLSSYWFLFIFLIIAGWLVNQSSSKRSQSLTIFSLLDRTISNRVTITSFTVKYNAMVVVITGHHISKQLLKFKGGGHHILAESMKCKGVHHTILRIVELQECTSHQKKQGMGNVASQGSSTSIRSKC